MAGAPLVSNSSQGSAAIDPPTASFAQWIERIRMSGRAECYDGMDVRYRYRGMPFLAH